MTNRINELACLNNRLEEGYGSGTTTQFLAIVGTRLDPDISVVTYTRAKEIITQLTENQELRQGQLLSFLPLQNLFTVTL